MNTNNEQSQAINSNADKLLVMAGAGAGKTYVMIERINRLINEGVDPSSILVLTFTNNAAFEMKERYIKLNNNNPILPEFRTFHGFCYSLIVKDPEIRNRLGYIDVPKIITEAELKLIQTSAKLQTHLKISTKKLKNPELLNKSEIKAVETYHKAIRRLLKAQNFITFDILCYDICRYFIDGDPCIFKYKQQYRYLFVDEFQDTDPIQVNFIKSFKDIHWFLCGDALQNIYGFRGCSNETLKELANDPEWTKIKMYQNYRSTNQICNFANKHSCNYAEESYRIEMQGSRDGEDIDIITGSRATFQESVDKNHIVQIKELAKTRNEDMAIICRTNKEVKTICDALDIEKIEYNNTSKNTSRIEILKSVLDNQYMLDWLSSNLKSEVYFDFIRQRANTDNPDIFWFANLYGKEPEIQINGNRIIAIRKILKENQSNIEKYNKIFEILDMPVVDLNTDIENLNPIQLIQHIIESVNTVSDKNLYVGTIHSVKGLEYGHVIIVGVDDINFKINSEESKNIYYVAITRAKNHLTIFRK